MRIISDNKFVDMSDEYKYHDSDSFENNFFRWHLANTLEKEIHNEKPYTEEEAYIVFRKLWVWKKGRNRLSKN